MVEARGPSRPEAEGPRPTSEDHHRHEHRRTPGRRAAAPAPCRSGRRRPARRSARARCRRRPRVARTTSRPPALTVAPVTASPGPTSTGTLSPVSRPASTRTCPRRPRRRWRASRPGRTTKRSPTRGRRSGPAPRRRRGAPRRPWPRAPGARAERRPDRRLARASRSRPARRKTVTAATSR